MTDKPQYFSGLKLAPIPDVFTLTGPEAYIQEYNRQYAEVARGLQEAAQALRTLSETQAVSIKDIGTLAALALRFSPDESVKETKQYVVSPDQRFHPSEMESEDIYERDFNLSLPQTLRLVKDLKRLGISLQEVASTSNKNPEVSLRHIVSAHNFNPSEKLDISLQEDGKVYKVGIGGYMPIDPERVESVEFDTYTANQKLGLFDQTESGPDIPIGLNRLALLYASQKYLAEEVRRQQTKGQDIRDRLKGLSSGSE